MSRRKTKIIGLVVVLLLCLGAPIASMFVDFGGGTDDAASDQVRELVGLAEEQQVLEVPNMGFEPSEALEPWMFVLQVLIGILLFVGALIAIRKLPKHSAK